MDRLKEHLLPYVERIGEHRFYVRAKRRGHRGELSSHEIEKEASQFPIDLLEKAGKTPHVDLKHPDVILVIETVANWAGLAAITKEMKEKDMHLILTGRDAHPQVIDLDDTVSEVKEVQHAYRHGIEPQPGIDD